MQTMHFIKALFVAALILAATGVHADVPKPEIITGEGKCVEPVEDMRKNHMEYILHQRDDTMYQGIRTSRHSFKQCISCHAVKDDNGEFVTIDDSRHFCVTCHEYASVKIDCFQCHTDTPKSTDIHELRVNK